MSTLNLLDCALTEDEREQTILDEGPALRLVVGQHLCAIGPVAGSKLRPDGPAETQVLEVDEPAGGYRIEKYPGCCSDLITFAAVERMWVPVAFLAA